MGSGNAIGRMDSGVMFTVASIFVSPWDGIQSFATMLIHTYFICQPHVQILYTTVYTTQVSASHYDTLLNIFRYS